MQTDTIHFSAPHDKELTIQAGKIRWEIQAKKSRRSIYLLLFSLGIIFLPCLLDRNDPSDLRRHSYIGIAISVGLFYESINYFRRKDHYKKIVLQMADRLDQFPEPVIHAFSDEKVCYRDAEKYMELKWSLLKAYSIYKDHLVIWLGPSSLDAIIFIKDKEGLDPETYARLLELVKQKLPEQKT